MGYDLFGVKPVTKKGEYFRNSIWWWPRLWDFCCHVTPEITPEEQKRGQHNDGIVISDRKRQALVRSLRDALDHRDEYAEWLRESENRYANGSHWSGAILEALKGIDDKAKVAPTECRYHFDWHNVEEFLEFISNNKGFQIC